MRKILSATRVVPVLEIERREDAVPLARALARGGLLVLEVTLRTADALAAIRAIAAAVPEVTVGAGTVTRPQELAAVRAAGARFVVSPGFTNTLAQAVRDQDLPWLPGVMTVSEALVARDAGWSVLKLFPARFLGGPALVHALAGPLPDLQFCPTGGIDAQTFPDYLALPNVLAVGGSWVAPKDTVAAGDWERITDLARAAAGWGNGR